MQREYALLTHQTYNTLQERLRKFKRYFKGKPTLASSYFKFAELRFEFWQIIDDLQASLPEDIWSPDLNECIRLRPRYIRPLIEYQRRIDAVATHNAQKPIENLVQDPVKVPKNFLQEEGDTLQKYIDDFVAVTQKALQRICSVYLYEGSKHKRYVWLPGNFGPEEFLEYLEGRNQTLQARGTQYVDFNESSIAELIVYMYHFQMMFKGNPTTLSCYLKYFELRTRIWPQIQKITGKNLFETAKPHFVVTGEVIDPDTLQQANNDFQRRLMLSIKMSPNPIKAIADSRSALRPAKTKSDEIRRWKKQNRDFWNISALINETRLQLLSALEFTKLQGRTERILLPQRATNEEFGAYLKNMADQYGSYATYIKNKGGNLNATDTNNIPDNTAKEDAFAPK